MIKQLLTLLVVLFTVQTSYSQTPTTIQAIKSTQTNFLFDTVKIEGYLVCDNLPFLVTDISYYLKNSLIPEENYISIKGQLASYIIENKENLQGRKVQIVGVVRKSDTLSKNSFDTTGLSNIYIESNQEKPKKIGKSKLPKSKFSGITIDTSSAQKNNGINYCNKYALLYSGGVNSQSAYNRYYNDLEFMYLTLKYRYGYTDENIVVVYKDGYTINPSRMPIDFPANRLGLDNALNLLHNKMGDNGDLFMFITNHGGGYSSKESRSYGIRDYNNDEIDFYKIDETIYYYNEYPVEISDDVFAQKIAFLNLKNLIAVFEPCFSGGFVRDLRATNRIVITAANEFEPSWACRVNQYFDEFSYYFTSALNGAFPDGRGVNADNNNDGIISIFEAYYFALQSDRQDEHPMLDDNGDGLSDVQDGFYSRSLSLVSCDNYRIDNLIKRQ